MTIREFPLAWRWTQQSHAVLPSDVLARIRPLNSEQAARIYASGELRQEGKSASCSTNDKLNVRDWLRHVQPDLQAEIFMSWSDELAVETAWDVFTEYWEDFCYPSSDDVIVIPVAGNWRLIYHHYEQFDFVSVTSGHQNGHQTS
jgi:hypothetical protein